MQTLPITLDSGHIAAAKAWFGADSSEFAVIERAERAGLGRADTEIVERVEAVLRKASNVSWEYFGWDDVYRETYKAFEEAVIAMQRGDEPELARWGDVLPKTRMELYAVLAILLTVLSILMTQGGGDKQPTESEAETLVRNAVREALEQVQSQALEQVQSHESPTTVTQPSQPSSPPDPGRTRPPQLPTVVQPPRP